MYMCMHMYNMFMYNMYNMYMHMYMYMSCVHVAESDRYLEFEADPRREKNAFFAFRLQPDPGAGG